MSIYIKDKRYIEFKFSLESEFEENIFKNSKRLFGENCILLNVKKKIDSGDLGKAIPDGFLFDFSDKDDPKFYIIEVELQSHDFYRHIFPQITKFFAFVKGSNSQQGKLIDALYRIIESDPVYKNQFKKYIGDKELFKFLKDLIEGSGDILLVIDGNKPEINEIMLTYSDTWGKYVKLVIARNYVNQGESIIYCEPDFEAVDEATEDNSLENEDNDNSNSVYNETYHLSDSTEQVIRIFQKIKKEFSDLIFNPQRYYVSIKNNHNFAYIKIRKKIIRIVVLLPISEVSKLISHHSFKEPSESVQKFYGSKCTEIKIDNDQNLNEIIKLLSVAKSYKLDKLKKDRG